MAGPSEFYGRARYSTASGAQHGVVGWLEPAPLSPGRQCQGWPPAAAAAAAPECRFLQAASQAPAGQLDDFLAAFLWLVCYACCELLLCTLDTNMHTERSSPLAVTLVAAEYARVSRGVYQR